MNFTDLDTCVRSMRDEMIDFTSELVAIASENPPGNAYPECVRVIESRLRGLDLPCEIVRYRSPAGTRDGSGAAAVLSSVGTGTQDAVLLGSLRRRARHDAGPVHAGAPRAGRCSAADRRT